MLISLTVCKVLVNINRDIERHLKSRESTIEESMK